MRRPDIFVSSTCYDLKQVRADIKAFLEGLGLNPILSELGAFPINPDASTVENCLKAIEHNADIFVLIVGARYGSVTTHGKSITNLEFLTAKAKGIPAYIFVMRSILNVLPVWKANPSANFGTVTDSPKLFEFVAGLMETHSKWIFPFEIVQDVHDILRTQLANLFMDALELRQRTTTIPLSGELRELRGPSFRLVIERPFGWGILLFAQVLEDELKKQADLKRDWQSGIAMGAGSKLKPQQIMKMLEEKPAHAMRIAKNIESIFHRVMSNGFSPDGIAGNPEEIVYAAKRISMSYAEALHWKLDFLRVVAPNEMRALMSIAGSLCDNLVPEIEDFSSKYKASVKPAIDAALAGQSVNIEVVLKPTIPNMDAFHAEVARLAAVYQSGAAQRE